MVTESWLVLGQMSPYLLLGFFVAGLLSVCISPAWVERHLGRRGWGSVLAASLFGVPLPLCSCGVIPVSASIRRHGASRAATTAFLLSTPQTGVDSIAVTYAMLGPVFAVFRPLAALVTGVVGGLLVQVFDDNGKGEREETDPAGASKPDTRPDTHRERWWRVSVLRRAVRYGFVTLPRDIGPALLVGIVIAGAMAALVPQDQLHKYFGGGILSILMLMAVGVPVYVCATASVPIAAGFMHLGASPGAALAFLIAGPATNAATLATIWKVLGRRTAVLYLGTVAVSAVVCGLLIDWLMPLAAAAMPQLGGHDHAGAGGGWPVHAWAIALLAVLAISYRAKDAHEREHVAGEEGTTGERLELRVVGMTCSHCAESVGRALAESDGVLSADVDLRTGRAVVVGNYLDRRKLVAAITELGYTVEEMPSGGSHTA
jgi:uncharacterized membrane protein YraQ (UPF0718 family)/copper chaperone CopZ